jgi:hypothetical protein
VAGGEVARRQRRQAVVFDLGDRVDAPSGTPEAIWTRPPGDVARAFTASSIQPPARPMIDS